MAGGDTAGERGNVEHADGDQMSFFFFFFYFLKVVLYLDGNFVDIC